MKKRFRGFREEVGRAFGPKVLKVLRFDSGFTAEGCGIAAFGGDEYIVSAYGIYLMSPVQHGAEQKPPSIGRGRRQATEDRGVSSFQNLSDLSSALSGSSFLRKEPYVTGYTFLYHRA